MSEPNSPKLQTASGLPQPHPDGGQARPFVFERDTFAFPNELYWEYRFDPASGTTTTFRNPKPHPYSHRCFVLARSARQFFEHAHFEPSAPETDTNTYRELISQVVSRTPRQACSDAERIHIPGYNGLRAFSQGREDLLKAECGGAWQSYFLRSHWRMVFPTSRRHQARMAEQLMRAFASRSALVVHLVRFPALTINHGIVLFASRQTEAGLEFKAYDPNAPDKPTLLTYDRPTRTFLFPRNHYWAGGRVDVIEVYHGWLY